jgi:hypothetical protein
MHEKENCIYEGNRGGAIKMENCCGVKHIKHSKLKTRVFHGKHILEEYL